MLKKNNLSVGFYVNVFVGIVFILSSAFIIFFINNKMREQTLLDAETKAKLILDRNLATHTYFSHNLKPSVFELTDPYRPEEYFDPAWMSSTFAIREIDNYFKSLETSDYYYKECAINARSPENEADEYERDFIKRTNQDPQLIKQSDLRVLDGKRYFVVLRRGEVMEESCLRCHDTSKRAPLGLVQRYGSERSFFREQGEVVSAISIRIPIDIPYAQANQVTWELFWGMVIILLVIFVFQYLIHRWIVTSPLNNIQKKANQIANNEERIGDEVPIGFGKELTGLAHAFNSMSKKLRNYIDSLEDKVQERTAELSVTNRNLGNEIDIRKQSETEKEHLIQDLEKALSEIKTLGGLLPICSNCKRIRDDKGYWNQIETYIRDRSDAEFTHGICPDCAKKLYPNIKKPD